MAGLKESQRQLLRRKARVSMNNYRLLRLERHENLELSARKHQSQRKEKGFSFYCLCQQTASCLIAFEFF